MKNKEKDETKKIENPERETRKTRKNDENTIKYDEKRQIKIPRKGSPSCALNNAKQETLVNLWGEFFPVTTVLIWRKKLQP